MNVRFLFLLAITASQVVRFSCSSFSSLSVKSNTSISGFTSGGDGLALFRFEFELIFGTVPEEKLQRVVKNEFGNCLQKIPNI